MLPKGIIHFTNSVTRRSNGGSKSAERSVRRSGVSHEPREESLRRKKKVMQIIRNFENDKDNSSNIPSSIQAIGQGNELNHKELSFLLKSKIINRKDKEMPSIVDDNKVKVMIHKRITKTFAANTPE